PVLFARVKLAVSPGLVAGAVRSVVAQANVDLSGRLIRAQGVAENMRTAIELMCERLGVLLRNAGGGQGEFSLRRAGAGPRVPRPRLAAEGAHVVRRKAFGLSRLTVDEAIAELEAFDFDFHLFTERLTGSDSVVYTTVRGYRVFPLWLDSGVDHARRGVMLPCALGLVAWAWELGVGPGAWRSG